MSLAPKNKTISYLPVSAQANTTEANINSSHFISSFLRPVLSSSLWSMILAAGQLGSAGSLQNMKNTDSALRDYSISLTTLESPTATVSYRVSTPVPESLHNKLFCKCKCECTLHMYFRKPIPYFCEPIQLTWIKHG